MVIIYKTTQVPNFAQGEMAMLSTYIGLTLMVQSGWSWFAALLGALTFAALLGAFFEYAFLRRARKPQLSDVIIMTLGFQFVLQGFGGWKWGPVQKDFRPPFSGMEAFRLGELAISPLDLITFGSALSVMAMLYFFFGYSRMGTAMRAAQQNPLAARINGISIHQMNASAWMISSVVGAVAGLLLAPVTSLDPLLMWDPLLKGFAAAVLGGMTSLPGAVLGGFLLALIESLFGAYISLEFKSVVAFAVIVLVLWFRPSGLFSAYFQRKV